MKTNIKPWLLLSPFLLTPAALLAQQASTPDTSEPSDKDVVVLSPFQVTGDSDVGYQATSTLAGTRLRTEMRDIGSSISIVNEEFLRDTGSQNIEDVLIFTPNTEVAGLGGNWSATQAFGNPIPEQQRDSQGGGYTRIRGLAQADLTRDYFITSTPFDTYNTDRVDVQRGANSALFGLGSPGGIINNSIIKADFLKNRGDIGFQTDSYGTQRYTMRYNRILNKYLAIRVAGLRENTKYEQKQAWNKDKRLFVAATANLPFNLTVRGSYEWADRSSARPDYVPPNDGITPWINMGKPTFDTPAEAGYWFRATGDVVPGHVNNQFMTLAASGISAGYASFYLDPSNPNPTFGGTTYVRGGRGIPTSYGSPGLGEWMMLEPFTETQIIRRSGFHSDGTPVATGTSGFYSAGFVGQQILDRSVYDYRKNLFSGGSSQEFANWKLYNASIEGNWLDGRIGAELAWFKQDMATAGYNALQGSEQRTIYIDPNRYLIATTDGSGTGTLVPNPAFGKPVMGGLSGGNNITDDRNTWRAQVFGEIRAEDFMAKNWVSKLLGRLVVTGLKEETSTHGSEAYSRDQLDIRSVATATSGGVIAGTNINSADARAGMVFALPYSGNVDFLAANSISDLAGAGIGGVSFGNLRDRPPGGTFTGWDSVSNKFKTFTSPAYTLRDNNNFPASFSSSQTVKEINSKVIVGQEYLWDGAVVLTGTWRSDQSFTGSIGAPQNYLGVPGVENVFDPTYLAGVRRPLTKDADAETKSWSIMIHTPDFLKKYLPQGWDLSVYKSKADNFRPSGGRVNIYNEQIPANMGATEETGFIISALDGKLQGRFNWYKTGVLNNSFDIGNISSSEGILLALVRQLDNPLNTAQGFTAADVQAVLPPQGVLDVNGFQPDYANAEATTNRNSNDNGTQDFTSKGFEFEVTYNPTEKWTMLLGVAKQETVTSNTYPVFQQYVNDFVLPKWVNSSFAQHYYISDTSNQTLAELAQSALVDPTLRALEQDGNPAKEERQWRWNYNTSYNFGKNSDIIPKWLGDFTVGGGIRWQDKMGIGFPITISENGNYGPDRSRPFYAPAQTFVDVFVRSRFALAHDMNLSIQLNVKDLTDHNGLVPFVAEPDGTMLYRILEGRLFVLSGTLEF